MVWYDVNYPRRRKITIPSGVVYGGPHNDFPISIQIEGDYDIFDKTTSSGSDIIFVDRNNNPLWHELTIFSGEKLTAYVKTSISGFDDNIFYIYYGSGGNSNRNDPNQVWTNGYVAIWHFDDPNDYSSSYGGIGVTLAKNITNVSGTIGNAAQFDVSNFSKIIFDTAAIFDSAADQTFTFSTVSLITGGTAIYAESYNTTTRTRNYLFSSTTIFGFDQFDPSGGTISTSITSNNWHHLVYRQNASYRELRVDSVVGNSDNSPEVYTGPTPNNSAFGARAVANNTYPSPDLIGSIWWGYHWSGKLSEFRIHSIYRSEDWIDTEYENLMNNSSFFNLGSIEIYNKIKYAIRTNNPGWGTIETVTSGIRPQISLAQNGYVYISYLDGINNDMKSTRKQLTVSGWETPWTTATGVLNFQTQWAFFPRGEIKSYNEPLWGVSSIIERNSVYYHKIDGATLETGYINKDRNAIISGVVFDNIGGVIKGS